LNDPVARNLHRNYKARIRERGEHCSFISFGSIEITIAGEIGQKPRVALLPICLKKASYELNGDKVKVIVSDEETWILNVVLKARLRDYGISLIPGAVGSDVNSGHQSLHATSNPA
jgi:hypothetical protein